MSRMPRTARRSFPVLAAAVAAAGLLATSSATAQSTAAKPSVTPGRAPASTTVVRTRDYTETQLQGNQVVEFPGDELGTDGPSIYGDTVRRPPGVIRHGLLQPRLNFVSELVKSVENL